MAEASGFDPNVRQAAFIDAVPTPEQAAKWVEAHGIPVDSREQGTPEVGERSEQSATDVGGVILAGTVEVAPAVTSATQEAGGRSGFGVVVLDRPPADLSKVVGAGYERRGDRVAPTGSFGPTPKIG